MDRRYRCAGRAQGRRRIRAPRSLEREISAHRQQPLRHRLHGHVRHAWSASRSSAPPAHCASPRPTASSNAARRWCRKSFLGKRKAASPWASATRLLESLPPFEDGPGNGQWNLGQYLVARGSDLPLHDLEIEVLPPVTPDEPPKGIAEVVMIPVVPALLNAICRCHRPPLPIAAGNARHAQGSAVVTSLALTINGRAYGPIGRARRSDDERLPARASRADRHEVRLRRRAVPELRGDRR